ncbi:uncharacterized protein FIBRA_08223 [Fibroporia radiculosa]|uniref:Uncharacterized protein n=1 Tax=Fibroporia radiculosa TaxID=599839 RepID=J4I2E0_9APHY|nr:uncharacterized protein FIBRA_08223 [Fibroporia radiculosa]CCM05982.1 predicted protein [Fibroporia radiculosa]
MKPSSSRVQLPMELPSSRVQRQAEPSSSRTKLQTEYVPSRLRRYDDIGRTGAIRSSSKLQRNPDASWSGAAARSRRNNATRENYPLSHAGVPMRRLRGSDGQRLERLGRQSRPRRRHPNGSTVQDPPLPLQPSVVSLGGREFEDHGNGIYVSHSVAQSSSGREHSHEVPQAPLVPTRSPTPEPHAPLLGCQELPPLSALGLSGIEGHSSSSTLEGRSSSPTRPSTPQQHSLSPPQSGTTMVHTSSPKGSRTSQTETILPTSETRGAREEIDRPLGAKHSEAVTQRVLYGSIPGHQQESPPRPSNSITPLALPQSSSNQAAPSHAESFRAPNESFAHPLNTRSVPDTLIDMEVDPPPQVFQHGPDPADWHSKDWEYGAFPAPRHSHSIGRGHRRSRAPYRSPVRVTMRPVLGRTVTQSAPASGYRRPSYVTSSSSIPSAVTAHSVLTTLDHVRERRDARRGIPPILRSGMRPMLTRLMNGTGSWGRRSALTLYGVPRKVLSRVKEALGSDEMIVDPVSPRQDPATARNSLHPIAPTALVTPPAAMMEVDENLPCILPGSQFEHVKSREGDSDVQLEPASSLDSAAGSIQHVEAVANEEADDTSDSEATEREANSTIDGQATRSKADGALGDAKPDDAEASSERTRDAPANVSISSAASRKTANGPLANVPEAKAAPSDELGGSSTNPVVPHLTIANVPNDAAAPTMEANAATRQLADMLRYA